MRIKRPWGSQFTDKKTNLIARAELVENGRLVTLDASKIRYLWFIEQPDATDYEDIVGTGWVFLNDTGSNPEYTYQNSLPMLSQDLTFRHFPFPLQKEL